MSYNHQDLQNEINQLQNTIRRITYTTNTIKSQINCDTIDSSQGNVSNLDDIEYLQMQINNLNQKLTTLLSIKNVSDTRYQQIVSELDNIYTLVGNNYTNNNNNSETNNTIVCCTQQLIFTDTSGEHTYVIDNSNTVMIFLTMVGGGGGGGIGYVDQFYYYSGGGGGAGSAVFKVPITVSLGTILKIKIGKGGDTCLNVNGEKSYVKIIYPSGETNIIEVDGGLNGQPIINTNSQINPTLNTDVTGGNGGSGTINALNGQNGDNGEIAVPSFPNPQSGDGGDSAFSQGGDGGSNLFSRGGIGARSTDTNRIGKHGKFGSGGGGSLPRIITNQILSSGEVLSGLGGDGLVIIELV